MSFVSIELHNSVCAVILNRGVTNPLNLDLIEELSENFARIETDTALSGVILTSANQKFFSIGLDIPNLIGLSRDEFSVFYKAFNRLCIQVYAFPKPVIAAVTGHATAGGCILALCCDTRYMAEGRKLMGLNEIKLGVPVPYPADCILRDLVGTRTARKITDSGEFFAADGLSSMGVVDRILPVGELIPSAVEALQNMSQYSPGAFAMIKRNRTEPVVDQIHHRLVEKEEFFIDSWYTPECRVKLEEAAEKF